MLPHCYVRLLGNGLLDVKIKIKIISREKGQMSKRSAELENLGELLKRETKKSKDKKAKALAKAKKEQREREECIVLGRVVTMERIRADLLTKFKSILKTAAYDGLNATNVRVSKHHLIDDVGVHLFEWECRDIAAWLKVQFMDIEGLEIDKIGDTIRFKW